MNMHVGNIERTFKDRYAEVRARLFSPPPKPKIKLIAPLPKVEIRIPLWKQEDLHFNHHVLAWMEHRSAPVKSYIKIRCREMGIGYLDIMSGSRHRPIITVRHLLMFEVWKRFNVTYLELSRHFGLKDHTTALHAVEKFAKHGIHTFNKPEQHATVIKEMWITGRSLREIAAETGCAFTSVNLFAKKQGWKRR